ncbi:UDP-glucose 4-epimerase [Lewinella marina]|uniref:UDP-glucose 4-epimerase n=1 Tax=Neolewinella marina TaxID=438751 RepID=A0A2G0CJ60_9BACT|nr:UDP-glucose 4-epimerase GalE [Neolewinella marina]NJB84835.1 UDP-glucose 4-epimerase [Neolewinella marina]PHL00009.1 UDP-glucose 4-epimerase GalE [Neolewinella marina]
MSKGKILVAGGTGYIGSHTVVDLIENGFEVVSADNYHNSKASVLDGIEAITGVRVVNHTIDLADPVATAQLFEKHAFDGAIHFAAYKSVGESVDRPLEYYRNNLNSLLNVIDGLRKQKKSNLVFSSSCSVYGNADELPVTEATPRKEAESPYARTKQMGEDILYDFCGRYPDFAAVLLRYFNPAGAHPSGKIGEDAANPASNLVPVITEVGAGKREKLTVFGDDYDTRDGSCVRDYIHVADLAHAHTLALEYLMSGKQTENPALFNLGIGEGLTVLEAIHAFERVSGKSLNYEIGPRRPGDVVAVYADRSKATEVLGWKPRFGVDDIMRTAWNWEEKR